MGFINVSFYWVVNQTTLIFYQKWKGKIFKC